MSRWTELDQLAHRMESRVRAQPPHIVVIGDMILDNSIVGEPGGRHPDTGVEILRDATSQESIGGAANIAMALTRLGAEVSVFGLIGSDLHGRQMENLVERQLANAFLLTQRGWPTPHKDWLYCREGGRERLFQRIDYDRPLPPRAREELVGEFRVHGPPRADVTILADHGLGSIGPESLALIPLARERQSKLVAIPRTTVLRRQPLDAIVLNAQEMRRFAEAPADADPKPLAARYARDAKQNVIVTLFEKGLFVCPADAREPQHIEGCPVAEPDWMGARDITTAIVALGLALDWDIFDIARVSLPFRQVIAGQRGNGQVRWRDVYQFVTARDR